MFWRQLVKKGFVNSQVLQFLSLQDNEGLLRNFVRFHVLENKLQASLRFMSTYEVMDDRADMDDCMHQSQDYKARRKSFSRGRNLKTKNFTAGRSRYPPNREIQPCKASSIFEESLQQTLCTLKPHGRACNGDNSLENMHDGVDTDEEEEEAVLDDSDMDSDNDTAKVITPDEIFRGLEIESINKLSEKEQDKARRKMMDKLVSAALDDPEENEDEPIQEDEQHSLRVGIIGAVNSGKSTLTNFMVGTKVAAVSRKRNTTLSEILGVITKGDTQILLYDTPGLVLDILGRPSKSDTRHRSENAWQLFSHCEVILVLVDAYRQIHKPDKRVLRLVERLGTEENPNPKRVLVLNKVDIVENKKQLLPLAEQFEKLPGYECIFMVSALTGSGVRDILTYLTNEAVLRPWEEEPDPLNEETIKTLSMEVVREHLLDRVHEEIPYELDHQLVEWQELEDGSLRIEQHIYLPKKGQCRIVVGKGGSKIREIGIKACEELRALLKRQVHLYLEVKHGGGA